MVSVFLETVLFALTIHYIDDITGEQIIPGLDFIAKGYNLLKANPHASGVNADPGFLLPVFNISACCQKNTLNGYNIPNNVNADTLNSCNKVYLYTGITGVQHLYKEYTKYVSFSGSVGSWMAFSESAEFQAVYKQTTVSHDVYCLSTWDCSAYKFSLNDPYDLPPIHMNFQKMVQNMPTTYSSNTQSYFYGAIDQDFGTHYVYNGNWGGITGSLDATVDNLYSSFASSNLQINTSADYHMLSVSTAKSSMTDNETKEAEAFASIVHAHLQFEIGGQPPSNGEANAWNKVLQGSSVPLKISIKPLSDLLTTMYFKNDKDIAEKQTAWMDAVKDYCNVYKQKHPSADINCNGYPNDRSLPPRSIWKGLYVPPDVSDIKGNNPYTGGANCPGGFKPSAWIMNAQGNNIWHGYMCLNQTALNHGGKDPANIFGGMWMTDANQQGCLNGNPMNGNKCSCVSGYQPVKSYTYCMANGQMYSGYVCLKSNGASSDSFIGGFYQTGYYKLLNPWTKGESCPASHQSYSVAENFVCNGKSSNDKCSLYICLSNVYSV